ncbi:MAG: hypothetical protein QXO51_08685 [Halobacteria archaeon]
MRLPRRNRAELLWRSGGDPARAPSPRPPAAPLLLATLLGALAALYPAVLPLRLLLAFLAGLFAGSALPALARRCPKCRALAPPFGGRFCGSCGASLDR